MYLATASSIKGERPAVTPSPGTPGEGKGALNLARPPSPRCRGGGWNLSRHRVQMTSMTGVAPPRVCVFAGVVGVLACAASALASGVGVDGSFFDAAREGKVEVVKRKLA